MKKIDNFVLKYRKMINVVGGIFFASILLYDWFFGTTSVTILFGAALFGFLIYCGYVTRKANLVKKGK